MKTLLVGYKAADLTPELLDGDVTCHVLDIYHRHAIEKVHHAKVVCSAHLPEGPWDLVRFKTGPKIHSGELALDLLQECYKVAGLRGRDAPAPLSGRVEVAFEGRERDRNDLLNKIKDDPKRVRSFKAEWPASVPGGEKLMFTSYPGCFCHRRLDEGGLALAEVVSREILKSTEACACGDLSSDQPTNTPLAPALQLGLRPRVIWPTDQVRNLKILDMGCGCGLVGFLIANRLTHAIEQSNNPNNRTMSLVLVDSHARAVEAATENAAKFGIPAEVILSDNGTPERMDGTFDVFVGNPPYYSDYRIAEVFLETAKRALKPGGICYTVVKNAAGLKPVQERYFPQVEVVGRRGYNVLRSVKE